MTRCDNARLSIDVVHDADRKFEIRKAARQLHCGKVKVDQRRQQKDPDR